MISADQERLYVGGMAGVRVYDVHDGTLLDVPFPGIVIWSSSADGKVLAVFDRAPRSSWSTVRPTNRWATPSTWRGRPTWPCRPTARSSG